MRALDLAAPVFIALILAAPFGLVVFLFAIFIYALGPFALDPVRLELFHR